MPKKADVERPDPEIEQVSADQRSTTYSIFSFKTEHCHRYGPHIAGTGSRRTQIFLLMTADGNGIRCSAPPANWIAAS